MEIRIIDRVSDPKGRLYHVRIDTCAIKVLLLFHAIERMKKWEISDRMVLETMLLPEEVLVGHRSRYIAHRRYGNHVLRAIYEYQGKLPVLVTTYFPYMERYFEGGGMYEDKIFKGS